MLGALDRIKPGAPVRTQMLLAAAMWSVVGLGLLIAGTMWTARAETESLPLLLALALLVGVVKAVFVLRRAAKRVITRLEQRGDGRCIGGFFSWRTWLFVAVMMIGGRLVRASDMPIEIIGCVYVAVGSALLIASAWLWSAWYRQRQRQRDQHVPDR